jgi:hypothetical protein
MGFLRSCSMDLATELLREHSARQTQRLVRYVNSRTANLTELVDLVAGPPGRVSQLAAEILGWCAEKQPKRLVPHLPHLLPLLGPSDHHVAGRRGIARALQFVSVPDELQAETFDRCLELLGSTTEAVAVKAYALTVLTRLARLHPDLAAEVLLVLEPQLLEAPSSLRSRANTSLPILRQLVRAAAH